MAEIQNTSVIGAVIRVLISVIIIAIGVFRHLYGLEESTGDLLESGLASSSVLALLEVHVITALELVFVVWTIGFRMNIAYLVMSGLILAIYSFSYFLSLGNESYLSVDLTSINGMVGYPLVIVAMLFGVYAAIKLEGLRKWLPSWVGIVIGFGLIAGYASYYFDTIVQFSDQGNEYNVAYAKWGKYWEAVENQQPDFKDESEYTVCFFSTSCSHCNQAAKRIGVYRRKYPEKKVLAVFFGKSADGEFWSSGNEIKKFLERNNLDLPFIKMVDYEAISIADNRFPVMIEMKETKPQSIYVGEEVNAWAFDYLFKGY